jgi:anti-anti-sigma factor
VPIERWSENVIVAHLSDDPQFGDDMQAIDQMLQNQRLDAVLNLAAVGFLNSSNIARLLQIRKRQINNSARLVLCGLSTHLWGVFLVTGIDKIFEYSDDVTTSLATLQMQR